MAFTKVVGAGIHTLSNITSHNINSSGIITATKFVGPIEGNITAVDATFTGNVSIAKTLTYEDVTNVDSVGIITARNSVVLKHQASGKFAQLNSNAAGAAVIKSDPNNNADNSSIQFHIDGGEKARIASNGNVKIGSGAPSIGVGSGLEIDTGGAATIRLEDSSNTSSFEIQNSNDVITQNMYNSQPWTIAYSGNEKLRITSDGKVGIGTDSIGATLTVQSDSSNTSVTGHNYLASQSGIILQNRTSSSGHFTAYTGNVVSSGGYTQSGSLAFEATGSGTTPNIHITQRTGSGVQTKRLTIDTNGTVIIANKLTNNASYTSHNTNFYGGDVNTGGVRIELAHSTTTVSGNTASGAFPHHLLLSNYSGNGSANNRMCSIGFDIPTTSLHANATIAYQATAPGAGDFQFWLESGNTSYERFRITSGGYLTTNQCPALETTAGAINITGGTSGGRIAIQGTTTSANASLAEIFAWWGTNKIAGIIAKSGTDTTNKDDGSLHFYTRPDTATGTTERLTITSTGIHQITTPGSTTDGAYFSTLTINNTGSSTWSRLRFDRSGVARWGLALGTDDKFRISNLYTNGTSGSPNDNVFVIANNSHIGINEASPQSILDVRSDIGSHPLGAIFRKDYGGDTDDTSHKVALTIWGQDHNDIDHTTQDAYGPMIGFGARNDDSAPNTGDIRAAISYRYNGQLTFHTEAGGSVTDGSNERLRITGNGKIGINNTSPECVTGGIDMSSNDGTSGKSFTDMRGHSNLILRNPSTTQHSFTQLLFENGGGTSAATMFRHRLGSSQGSLQNFVGDLCLFRRTGNAGGANNDSRESTRFCGATEQARQIWWASGDTDTSGTSRLGWHHLSAQRDHPGTDAYSFFRLETGAASYARGGFGKYTCIWTTGHASGYGLQIGHF